MTFGSCVYHFLLMPLQLVFEVVYSYAYRFLGHPGTAIIALSLTINLLVLPLYRRADAMQEAQRDTEARLHRGVSHIRSTFRGDERTMMLQTYYRQNHYSPVSALRGATSLLLEIPFFIAAYRFLSGLKLLSGVSFGPIESLSEPDGLLVLGGLAVNVLPILMTAVNCVSSAIFSKNYPTKTKVQLYAMAAFFLVFLYRSPSGLVFYWTLNNVFSLGKTIVYRLKGQRQSREKTGRLAAFLSRQTADTRRFLAGALFLAVLTGALIPSAVIAASPQEFMNVYYFVHPLWYVAVTLLIALGSFVLWLGVFYWLASPRVRVLFDWGVWVACGVAIVDYLFFGTKLGLLSSTLQYDESMVFSATEKKLSLLAVTAAVTLLTLFFLKWAGAVKRVLTMAVLTLCCMSVINVTGIARSVAAVDPEQAAAEEPVSLELSRDGRNVIVLMLDRAMGEYIPYLFADNEELAALYDGFTYYSNVISFGGHTNIAAPALYGGYEYTPAELNRRDGESLADKHNEALRVLPVLFDGAGFDVTVCDPPYAGYQMTSDLSIYDDYPDIRRYTTIGSFSSELMQSQLVKTRYRNFFCYSIMKISPMLLQGTLYELGNYHQPDQENNSNQIQLSGSVAYGLSSSFYDSYSVLENLPAATCVTEGSTGSFLLMQNDTTHTSILFSEPDYEMAMNIDNTAYDAARKGRFTLSGRTLRVENGNEYGAYETNMAALLRVGAWLELLRDSGVYDNTRIILVSDHGYGYVQLEELLLDDSVYDSDINKRYGDAEFYFPLLMVKDFGATGFTVSEEFMTNADVATLATAGVIADPVNPFTGRSISSAEKTLHDQLILASDEYTIDTNNGNQFLAGDWYSVHDSIWDRSNWSLVAQNVTLP